MTKLTFKLNRKINFENEAGLLIFNYTDYKSHPNPNKIDWKDSYIDYKNNDKNVIKMEEYFKAHPAYMNFLREVRSESFYLIEDFFDDKNEDIRTLFYIYEKGDENFLPFILSIFQNLDIKDENSLSYHTFKELFDIFFFQYIGLDYINLAEDGVNTYKDLNEYMNGPKLMEYLTTSPFTDTETMTLLRAYQNTEVIYGRLKPLIEKLSEIIKDKSHILDDLLYESFENLEKTNYKIAYDFTKQVGMDEMISKDFEEITISILLLLPFTQMFRFMDFYNFNKAIKLGILVDKSKTEENPYKLSKISQDLIAISDPTRIQILDYLKESDYYAKELSDKLYITPATLSYHLNKLLISGFVGLRKEGRKYYYYLRKSGFEYLIENLAKFSENIKEPDNGKD